MPISSVHPSRQPYPFSENKNLGESIEMNGRKLKSHVFQVISATARKGISFLENGIVIILSPRIESPPSKFNGFAQGLRDMDYFNGHEVLLSTNTSHPRFEKLPPYTTWTYLGRNQRMDEDDITECEEEMLFDNG
jgi:hypothetical protein